MKHLTVEYTHMVSFRHDQIPFIAQMLTINTLLGDERRPSDLVSEVHHSRNDWVSNSIPAFVITVKMQLVSGAVGTIMGPEFYFGGFFGFGKGVMAMQFDLVNQLRKNIVIWLFRLKGL